MDSERVEAVSVRNGFWLELARAFVAVVIAFAVGGWTARGKLDDYDKRLSLVELQDSQTATLLGGMHDDIRDLRNQLIEGKR